MQRADGIEIEVSVLEAPTRRRLPHHPTPICWSSIFSSRRPVRSMFLIKAGMPDLSAS